jgi:hypothetical protein
MTRRAMPSPSGTNRAGLYLTAGATGYAFDAAPKLDARARCIDAAVRLACRAGATDDEVDAFLALCDQPAEAEDDAWADLEKHSAALRDPDSPEARHARGRDPRCAPA